MDSARLGGDPFEQQKEERSSYGRLVEHADVWRDWLIARQKLEGTPPFEAVLKKVLKKGQPIDLFFDKIPSIGYPFFLSQRTFDDVA